ncbi:MAG: YraN family protein [Ectothiorhodospiraceae bacterium]|nr:YraN family protein [Ectothiorhodospiraceae bacterium]
MPPSGPTTTARGALVERAARRHLCAHGLRVLHANYRCRAGEIDLVAMDGATLVFVEVRYRARRDYGGALESVTRGKQRRIVAAAEHFLAAHADRELPPCRFDVVTVEPPASGGPARITWIRDAFDA